MAVLSIMGLYNYDNTVLNGLINNLPSPIKVPVDSYPDLYFTPEPLDSDALIGELLLECAELEVLYPSVTTMSQAVNVWAITHKKVWQDYYNTMWYKYNPIWNKDGTITRTETEERNLKNSEDRSGNNNETRDLQNNENRNLTSTQTGESTRTDNLKESTTADNTRTLNTTNDKGNTHEVAGYNSNTLVTSTHDEETSSDSGTITDDGSGSRTNTGTVTSEDEVTTKDTGNVNRTDSGSVNGTHNENVNGTETGTITRTYEDKETGNIGITMTQQMIDAERETVKFNIYNMIIQEFKERFCLLLY